MSLISLLGFAVKLIFFMGITTVRAIVVLIGLIPIIALTTGRATVVLFRLLSKIAITASRVVDDFYLNAPITTSTVSRIVVVLIYIPLITVDHLIRLPFRVANAILVFTCLPFRVANAILVFTCLPFRVANTIRVFTRLPFRVANAILVFTRLPPIHADTAFGVIVDMVSLPIITIARTLAILTIFSFAIEATCGRYDSAASLVTRMVSCYAYIICVVIVLKAQIYLARVAMHMYQAFAIHPSVIHPSVIHPSAIHPSAIVADDGCPSVYKDNIFTLELMHDPVVASDGFTYERASILRWFSMGRITSPQTGAVLPNRNLITNNGLRSAIHEHRAAIANCDVNS